MISLIVLCCILTGFQYHWTGELAKSELDRMTKALSDQTKRLAVSFDSELATAAAALTPMPGELDRGSLSDVHLRRLREWKSTKPRPFYKRIGVAVPVNGNLELHLLDVAAETLLPGDWPDQWSALRENLEGKMKGGSPIFSDDIGYLVEYPVIGNGVSGPPAPGGPPNDKDRPGGPPPGAVPAGEFDEFGDAAGPPEAPGGSLDLREWVILELDPVYLEEKWFPELVATYLNPTRKSIYDLTVHSNTSGRQIFTTLAGGLRSHDHTHAMDFNFQGNTVDSTLSRPPRAVWTMEAGRRDGALEAAVSSSRQRNLGVAVVLNLAIIAAGILLVRVTRQSRKLAEEQMRFVANVTHELRTPLTVIRGAAHNIKRGIVKNPDAVGRYSNLILEHSESLGEMVEQVLDFSGAQRGQLGSSRESVDLAALLRAAISTVAGGARFNQCKVELDVPADFPSITADQAALRRVFMNLMENAAKHGGAGGWVGISARAADRNVEVKVSDHGPGIAPDELRDIFKPFFRGGIARSHQVRGSGLGLSLVREIVALHGGTISVDSEVGKGTTFTVSLPIDSAPK